MVFEVTAEKQAQDFLKFSILLHPRALSFNPSERECFTTADFLIASLVSIQKEGGRYALLELA